MSLQEVKKLKDEFYKWCSVLSVTEIMTNRPLVREIERLSKLLLEAEAKLSQQAV